eukprot:5093932-Amphidinium_carterae.1
MRNSKLQGNLLLQLIMAGIAQVIGRGQYGKVCSPCVKMLLPPIGDLCLCRQASPVESDYLGPPSGVLGLQTH